MDKRYFVVELNRKEKYDDDDELISTGPVTSFRMTDSKAHTMDEAKVAAAYRTSKDQDEYAIAEIVLLAKGNPPAAEFTPVTATVS